MKEVKHTVLWDICEKGKGDKYVELQNRVGQCWYIPLKQSNLHLSLFQPSSRQGKIVSSTFDILKHFPILLHVIHAKIVRLQFKNEFQEFVKDIFKADHCNFGVFCGSPGYHQKLTLSISNEKYILGYCKITDNTCIKNLFYNENDSLTYLKDQDVKNVPTSLFCGQLPFNQLIWAFVQTTCREKKVKVAKYTNTKLLAFVSEFNLKTQKSILFSESEFSKSLNKLKQHLFLLEDIKMQNTLIQGINVVIANQSSFKYFCASHGDLTPWNSFIVKDILFAFDLEYFKYSYTPFYDFFHFFTQEMLYNNFANAELVYLKYKDLQSHIFKNQTNINLYYLSYLLMIIEFYLNRDKGILNDRINECMDIWISLINYILEDVSKNN